MYQLKLPPDSNFRYLAMVYFLPEEYINPCPTLRKLPRNMKEVATPEIAEIINSDQFINEIGDTMAALAFPHFGVRGWKEDYTGYSPIWLLSYVLPLWAAKIEEITGWGLSALLNEPKEYEIPWFPCDYVTEVMANVVDQVIFEQGWRPIINAMKQMPCEENFTPWRLSRVRKDWFRKWNHTRAKLKTTSLEECIEDPNSAIHRIGDENKVSMEEKVESRDCVQRFKKLLSDKDNQILGLRTIGYTHEEIETQSLPPWAFMTPKGAIKVNEVAFCDEFLSSRSLKCIGEYDRDRVTIISDICATAKGYEQIALTALRKEKYGG